VARRRGHRRHRRGNKAPRLLCLFTLLEVLIRIRAYECGLINHLLDHVKDPLPDHCSMKTTFNGSEEHVRLNQRRPPQQQRRASSASTPTSAYTNTDGTNRRSDTNAEGLRRSSVPHLGVNGYPSSTKMPSRAERGSIKSLGARSIGKKKEMKTTFNGEDHVRLNQHRPPRQQRRAYSASTPASAYTNTDDLPSTNRRSDNAEGLRRSSVPHLGVNGLRSSIQTGSKNVANVVLNRRTSAPASTAPTSASTRSSQASKRASIQEFLATLRLPSGILSSVLECTNSCNSTLWLLDSSSAMKVRDSRVVCSDGMTSIDEVSRWHKLRDCIAFHSYMASKCWIRSHFWLLNDDDRSTTRKFHLCCGSPNDVANEISCLNAALKQSKLRNDQCPLADQLHKLVKKISNVAHTLVSNGDTVTVVICTQGVPTDDEGETSRDVQRSFWSAMKKLSKLPVKIVVRLCTDDESVCDVYNMMDARVENMDVLGDYWGEVTELDFLIASSVSYALTTLTNLYPLCLIQNNQGNGNTVAQSLVNLWHGVASFKGGRSTTS